LGVGRRQRRDDRVFEIGAFAGHERGDELLDEPSGEPAGRLVLILAGTSAIDLNSRASVSGGSRWSDCLARGARRPLASA
jgi:hypothetical protein